MNDGLTFYADKNQRFSYCCGPGLDGAGVVNNTFCVADLFHVCIYRASSRASLMSGRLPSLSGKC